MRSTWLKIASALFLGVFGLLVAAAPAYAAFTFTPTSPQNADFNTGQEVNIDCADNTYPNAYAVFNPDGSAAGNSLTCGTIYSFAEATGTFTIINCTSLGDGNCRQTNITDMQADPDYVETGYFEIDPAIPPPPSPTGTTTPINGGTILEYIVLWVGVAGAMLFITRQVV